MKITLPEAYLSAGSDEMQALAPAFVQVMAGGRMDSTLKLGQFIVEDDDGHQWLVNCKPGGETSVTRHNPGPIDTPT